MRQILKERFHLVLHEQQLQVDGYQLLLRRQGITFKPTPADFVPPVGRKFLDGGVAAPTSGTSCSRDMQFSGASMPDLATFLNLFSSRPIFDQTKLIDHYSFALQFQELTDASEMVPQYDLKPLGLELKPGKGPGLNLIIDHVEKPSSN